MRGIDRSTEQNQFATMAIRVRPMTDRSENPIFERNEHTSEAHCNALSKGCNFQFSSSASSSGLESATIPQPAWARNLSFCRINVRIKMLLSKHPSQSTRKIDPQ